MDFKKRKCCDTIYPGDVIVWKDYDSKNYTTAVRKVIFKPHQSEVDCMPLNEKGDYALDLDYGLTIDGSAVLSKKL